MGLSSIGRQAKVALSLFIRSSACCTSSSRGTVVGAWFSCKIVITGLFSCWVTKPIRVGASRNSAIATSATAATVATLLAVPFFACGAAAKLFGTPHIGHADRCAP